MCEMGEHLVHASIKGDGQGKVVVKSGGDGGDKQTCVQSLPLKQTTSQLKGGN